MTYVPEKYPGVAISRRFVIVEVWDDDSYVAGPCLVYRGAATNTSRDVADFMARAVMAGWQMKVVPLGEDHVTTGPMFDINVASASMERHNDNLISGGRS